MIKILRPVGIRGEHYEPGDVYEGPDERILVDMGKAEFVEKPKPEKKAPAKKKVAKKRATRKKRED